MKYTKKVVKTSGGLVVRIPSDIVKLMNLTDEDYVEIDLSKVDRSLYAKKKWGSKNKPFPTINTIAEKIHQSPPINNIKSLNKKPNGNNQLKNPK